MKLIDSHIHLPNPSEKPFESFQHMVQASGLSAFVLILNTQEQMDTYQQNLEKLTALGLPYRLAVLQAPTKASPETPIELTNSAILKIHPRISALTKNDFPAISQIVAVHPSEVVIVDCFPYGHHIEQHIGLELALLLAERYPHKKLVIAHGGGVDILRAMLYSRNLPNIYFDFSFSCNYLAETSVAADMSHVMKHQSDRLLFGSDYPSFHPEQAKEKYIQYACKAGLSQHQIENVLYKNVVKLFFGGIFT